MGGCGGLGQGRAPMRTFSLGKAGTLIPSWAAAHRRELGQIRQPRLHLSSVAGRDRRDGPGSDLQRAGSGPIAFGLACAQQALPSPAATSPHQGRAGSDRRLRASATPQARCASRGIGCKRPSPPRHRRAGAAHAPSPKMGWNRHGLRRLRLPRTSTRMGLGPVGRDSGPAAARLAEWKRIAPGQRRPGRAGTANLRSRGPGPGGPGWALGRAGQAGRGILRDCPGR